jgi:hypothetical protein
MTVRHLTLHGADFEIGHTIGPCRTFTGVWAFLRR